MTTEFSPFTGEQIRAARAIARLEQSALANAAGLSLDTIKRIEGIHGPVQVKARVYRSIIDAFCSVGVELEYHGDSGFGVRRVIAPPARARGAIAEGRAMDSQSRSANRPAAPDPPPITRATAPNGYAYWDRAQKLRFANQAYLDWFGCPIEELVGQSNCDLLGPDIHAANEVFILGALRGQKQSFERTVRDRDGRRYHGRIQYVPDVDDRGAVLGFWSVVTDITAFREAELQLARAAALVEKERNGSERTSRVCPETLAAIRRGAAGIGTPQLAGGHHDREPGRRSA